MAWMGDDRTGQREHRLQRIALPAADEVVRFINFRLLGCGPDFGRWRTADGATLRL